MSDLEAHKLIERTLAVVFLVAFVIGALPAVPAGSTVALMALTIALIAAVGFLVVYNSRPFMQPPPETDAQREKRLKNEQRTRDVGIAIDSFSAGVGHLLIWLLGVTVALFVLAGIVGLLLIGIRALF